MSRLVGNHRRMDPTDAKRRRSSRTGIQNNVLQTVGIVVGYALVWTFLALFLPDVRYVPSVGNIAMLMLTIWAALQIKVAATRYILLFWCIWFVLGSISLVAQNQILRGKNYNIDPSNANFYYLSCTLAAILGVLFIEFIQKQRPSGRALVPTRKISQIFWISLLIFPFLFIATVIRATGTIPLLSGQDFSALVYEQNYGVIYSFAVFIPVVCVMIWIRYLDDSSSSLRNSYRYLSLVLLIFFTVAASIDGKRIVSILVIGSVALFYLLNRSEAAKSLRVGLSAIAALFFYVLVQDLRTGNAAASSISDSSGFFATIGVEYRDFVYSFESFDSNLMLAAGYDWAGSTLAAATPSVLWTMLGEDKNSFIIHDSARTLMALFNVKLGIRIGLPGELWFYIGWAAPIVFAFFGVLIQFLSLKMLNSNHLIYKSIMIVQLTIFMLAVNGQSTFTFGLTLPLLYLALAVYVIETTFTPRARMRVVSVNK